jgi:hypothetical protein
LTPAQLRRIVGEPGEEMLMAAEQRRRAIVGAWLTMTIVGTAAITAPPVHADGNDDAFLHALKLNGIVPISNDAAGKQNVVSWAHWVCDQLSQGTDRHIVIQWLEHYLPGDDDLHAAFAREAVFYYCPANQSPFGW